MPVHKKISSFFKSFDYHGAPISFTYKDKVKHKTAFGGFITIASRLSIIVYLMIQMHNVIKKDSDIRVKSQYKSKTYDN